MFPLCSASSRLQPLLGSTIRRAGHRQLANLAHNVYEQQPAAGDTAPICIMHGLFGSKQNWSSLAKALNAKTAPTRKVLTLDARNHGESPHTETHSYEELADDVHDFLVAQNIGKTVLIGHSMGGRAMMCFALKYPDLVEKAIIVDISPVRSSPQLTAMQNMFAAMLAVQVPASLDLSAGRKVANDQLRSVMNDETRAFVMMNFVKRADGQFGWRTNVRTLHREFEANISRFPEPLLAQQFAGPTLFVGGRHSDYIAPDQMPAIQRIFPNSRLEMLNAGHLVHVDAAHDFLRLVVDFVNK